MNANEFELYRRIGLMLRDARVKLQLNQDEVANVLGLVRTSVVNVEKGGQKIPLHTLYVWCGVLGLDIRDILPPMEEIVPQNTFVSQRIERLEEELARLKRLTNGTKDA